MEVVLLSLPFTLQVPVLPVSRNSSDLEVLWPADGSIGSLWQPPRPLPILGVNSFLSERLEHYQVCPENKPLSFDFNSLF